MLAADGLVNGRTGVVKHIEVSKHSGTSHAAPSHPLASARITRCRQSARRSILQRHHRGDTARELEHHAQRRHRCHTHAAAARPRVGIFCAQEPGDLKRQPPPPLPPEGLLTAQSGHVSGLSAGVPKQVL
jgi:hypothetical protein